MRRFVLILAILALPGYSTIAFAAEEQPTPVPGAATASSEKAYRTDFAGLHFGAAMTVTVDPDKSRVEEAYIQVVDKPDDNPDQGAQPYVRVKKGNYARARIMLESHYFFRGTKTEGCSPEASCLKQYGWGPFVAIQPGSTEIIDAFGAGLMIGWKRPTADSQSFNIGIGAVLDANVRVLANGFTEDQLAPLDASGEPLEIQYKETDQLGYMLLFSFSF